MDKALDDLLNFFIGGDLNFSAAAVNGGMVIHIRVFAHRKRRRLPVFIIGAPAGMGKLQDVIRLMPHRFPRGLVGFPDEPANFPYRLLIDDHLQRVTPAVVGNRDGLIPNQSRAAGGIPMVTAEDQV